jgi:hypothetical protein
VNSLVPMPEPIGQETMCECGHQYYWHTVNQRCQHKDCRCVLFSDANDNAPEDYSFGDALILASETHPDEYDPFWDDFWRLKRNTRGEGE